MSHSAGQARAACESELESEATTRMRCRQRFLPGDDSDPGSWGRRRRFVMPWDMLDGRWSLLARRRPGEWNSSIW
jgi:hypothetical protein